MYDVVVSRRAIGLLVGAVIVLLLALKAVDVLCLGLVYTWFMVRRASVEQRWATPRAPRCSAAPSGAC